MPRLRCTTNFWISQTLGQVGIHAVLDCAAANVDGVNVACQRGYAIVEGQRQAGPTRGVSSLSMHFRDRRGIYVRNLGELNRALADHPYTDYLAEQASIAYEHNRTPAAEYGLKWAGPVEKISAATQQSAVDLLVAAQPIEKAVRSTTPS